MPSRKIPLFSSYRYHIYNRGLKKQRIFNDNKDYKRFLGSIERYLKDFPDISIVSFSLLPNHFHFILYLDKPGLEPGLQISDFMRKIQQSYATYYRYKYCHEFNQTLKFEGRFKAKNLDNEEYFNMCQSYVNFNAVKHGLVKDIRDWPYTSIHNILDTGKSPIINFGLKGFSSDLNEDIDLNDDGLSGMNKPGLEPGLGIVRDYSMIPLQISSSPI